MIFKSVLKYSAFVDSLAKSEREYLASNCTETRCKKGQVLFYEESIPFGVYFLVSGMVKLYKTGDEGRAQIFQICTGDDMFGFHPVLQNAAYPDSSSTLVESVIRFIPRQVFLDLVNNSPKLSQYLLQSLSEEFSDFVKQQAILTQKPIREKVAILLLALKDMFAENEKSDGIQLNRSDMANLCGTVRETVVRTLSDFKKDGLIEATGSRGIKIIDQKGLHRIANT